MVFLEDAENQEDKLSYQLRKPLNASPAIKTHRRLLSPVKKLLFFCYYLPTVAYYVPLSFIVCIWKAVAMISLLFVDILLCFEILLPPLSPPLPLVFWNHVLLFELSPHLFLVPLGTLLLETN